MTHYNNDLSSSFGGNNIYQSVHHSYAEIMLTIGSICLLSAFFAGIVLYWGGFFSSSSTKKYSLSSFSRSSMSGTASSNTNTNTNTNTTTTSDQKLSKSSSLDSMNDFPKERRDGDDENAMKATVKTILSSDTHEKEEIILKSKTNNESTTFVLHGTNKQKSSKLDSRSISSIRKDIILSITQRHIDGNQMRNKPRSRRKNIRRSRSLTEKRTATNAEFGNSSEFGNEKLIRQTRGGGGEGEGEARIGGGSRAESRGRTGTGVRGGRRGRRRARTSSPRSIGIMSTLTNPSFSSGEDGDNHGHNRNSFEYNQGILSDESNDNHNAQYSQLDPDIKMKNDPLEVFIMENIKRNRHDFSKGTMMPQSISVSHKQNLTPSTSLLSSSGTLSSSRSKSTNAKTNNQTMEPTMDPIPSMSTPTQPRTRTRTRSRSQSSTKSANTHQPSTQMIYPTNQRPQDRQRLRSRSLTSSDILELSPNSPFEIQKSKAILNDVSPLDSNEEQTIHDPATSFATTPAASTATATAITPAVVVSTNATTTNATTHAASTSEPTPASDAVLSTQLSETQKKVKALQSQLTQLQTEKQSLQQSSNQIQQKYQSLQKEQENLKQKLQESTNQMIQYEELQNAFRVYKIHWKAMSEELTNVTQRSKTEWIEKEEEFQKQVKELQLQIQVWMNRSREEYKKKIVPINDGKGKIGGEDTNQMTMTIKKDEDTNDPTILKAKLYMQQTKILELESKMVKAEDVRKQMHNRIQELRGNIRVYVRVRPFLENEAKEENQELIQDQKRLQEEEGESSSIKYALQLLPDGQTLRMEGTHVLNSTSEFSFDKLFPPSCSQMDVFEEVSDLIQSALDGYHVCLFSYGQTGSGKTHTMQGSGYMGNTFSDDDDMRGIIPRAAEQILRETVSLRETQSWNLRISVSFLEIYNEELRDLLLSSKKGQKGSSAGVGGVGGSASDQKSSAFGGSNPNTPPKLTIKRSNDRHNKRAFVDGLSKVEIETIHFEKGIKQLESIMKTAAQARSVAATSMNAQSSRSHSLFMLEINGIHPESGSMVHGSLNLCDLAGSERLKTYCRIV